MNAIAIKRYLPRRLFGRAVLILLVPIVFLQLIVGVVIIQRHFDGVTRQLARGVALEIAVIAERVEAVGGLDQTTLDFARPIGLGVRLDQGATIEPGFERNWWDWSGRVIKSTIDNEVPLPVAVDLAQTSLAALIDVNTSVGVLSFRVSRARMSARNPQQLIILMVVASILLTVISLIFLKNQVRPIRLLAHAADSFGKGQVVAYQPSGAEEVRRAGHAFLAMRSRIERQIEQRTIMLSGVSHDLRTPLTRMRLALATAEDESDLAEIENDITEMEGMLNEFLAFASGDQQEKPVEVDAYELAQALAQSARRDGHELTFVLNERSGGKYTVILREMAIRRAVQNLLSNAARYGDKRSMSLDLHDRYVGFIVEDDGPGIAVQDRSEAMKPFSRLDKARNQDKGGGVGLGLAIAQDIARSHGGRLTLDTSPELGGLRVTLTIPR